MAKVLNDTQGIAGISPLPSRLALHYSSIEEELEKLRKRVLELEKREKVIVIRDITREQAKKEIEALFKTGRTLYYSDIVEELGIDLKTVVDICEEFRANGKLEINARVL